MALSITVETDDTRALREAGEMLLRLAGPERLRWEEVTGGEPEPVISKLKDAVEQHVTVEGKAVADELVVAAPVAPAPPAPPAPLAAWPEPVSSETATPQEAPAPPTPTSGVELDSEGLPWDKRIHASTKTKRQSDNTWKLIKGIDKDLVEQVKAELRAVQGLPTAPVSAPTAPVSAPTAPVSAPAAPPTAGPTSFPALVQVITAKQAAGICAVSDLGDVCKKFGLPNMPAISQRPDLIPAFHAALEEIWATR